MIIALTTTASILALSACNSAENSDVIAETSAGNISKDEFYNSMKQQAGRQILQDMIYVKVLDEQYEVKDEEIDKQIDQMKEAYGEQYDLLVEQRGEDTIRELIKADLLKQQAVEASVTEIVNASHILVEDEETAKEVKKKLDEGESFEDLAAEYSKDGSAANGGELGWFTKGMMVPEFEEVAFSQEKDVVSEPVQTQHGFHIIKVTQTKEDFDKLSEEEKTGTFVKWSQQSPTLLQDALDNAVKDVEIDIKDKDLDDLFAKPEAEK